MLYLTPEDVFKGAALHFAEEWFYQDESATGRSGDKTFAELDPDFRVTIGSVDALRSLIEAIDDSGVRFWCREVCDNLEQLMRRGIDDLFEFINEDEDSDE